MTIKQSIDLLKKVKKVLRSLEGENPAVWRQAHGHHSFGIPHRISVGFGHTSVVVCFAYELTVVASGIFRLFEREKKRVGINTYPPPHIGSGIVSFRTAHPVRNSFLPA